ncbi:52 kDa repressor of the inhibitor of the protein kinase-like [Gordionus sp. m RMFG-2023]|uniref:52 kDa repressor of the inhibitor of the protein kinase-like n=1 Tax=Gordionus sp. m RMFG-2023 TaxID=3053472 RepID=UPI0031FD0694
MFRYPKRQNILNRIISETPCPTRRKKLQKACPTRWSLRHQAVTSFMELEEPIINALTEISQWSERDISTEASKLLDSILIPNFFFSLQCLNKLFNYTTILCNTFQKLDIDLIEVMRIAESILIELNEIRANVDDEFHILYVIVESKAQQYEFNICLPRLAARQAHRPNINIGSVEEYYKINLFIPLLDTFITQINERFLIHRAALSNMQILLPQKPSQPFSDGDRNKIKYLANFYHEDIKVSYDALLAECQLWYKRLTMVDIVPKNAMDALHQFKHILDYFPNILKLLYILATIPISTATNERTFSSLRRIKTYLRSTTSESRLNGLALLNIHRHLTPSTDEIIEKLALSQRKLD